MIEAQQAGVIVHRYSAIIRQAGSITEGNAISGNFKCAGISDISFEDTGEAGNYAARSAIKSATDNIAVRTTVKTAELRFTAVAGREEGAAASLIDHATHEG